MKWLMKNDEGVGGEAFSKRPNGLRAISALCSERGLKLDNQATLLQWLFQ